MAKLKSMREFVKDVRNGDIVRVVLDGGRDEISGYLESVEYWKDGIEILTVRTSYNSGTYTGRQDIAFNRADDISERAYELLKRRKK